MVNDEKNIDWICWQNRTGLELLTDDPKIKAYEIKMRLNTCRNCDDYLSQDGNSYCTKKMEKEKYIKK